MTVSKNIIGSRMELTLAGKFDAVSAPNFEAEITSLLDGIRELIIDIGAVEYISSAGLRTLLYLLQTMNSAGGTMAVRNVPEVIMNIFEVTNFTDFIKVI